MSEIRMTFWFKISVFLFEWDEKVTYFMSNMFFKIIINYVIKTFNWHLYAWATLAYWTFVLKTSSCSSSLDQKKNFSFSKSSLGKSEQSSVQSSPKNELQFILFVFAFIKKNPYILLCIHILRFFGIKNNYEKSKIIWEK